MGELLPIRRNREFAVSQRQEVGRTAKLSGGSGSQKVDRGTGLTVSETLRQMMSRTGLAGVQLSRRTLQTGEGVLAEVQEKLGRMAELAGEAARDGGADRAAIQEDITQLWEEIDRMLGSATVGGTQLFSDEGAPETDSSAGQEAALPDWLTKAVLQGTISPERLLAALGADKSASGADLVAALMGRPLESDPAAGYLATLYLGAVIAGGSQAGNLDPSRALDGLMRLLEKTAEGVPLDKAIELLTGGEYASLADFQEQFASGAVPGLQAFLEDLLLSGGGDLLQMQDPSLLSFMAGAGGIEPDLLMMLMTAGQVQASAPGASEQAGAANEAALTASMTGVAQRSEASQSVSVMRFGEIQVMGRDLSGVSFQEETGQLTIGGTADIMLQGTGRESAQTVLLTGSGTVTVLDLRTALLAADAAEARIVTVGRNILGEVRLGEATTLTLDGRGLLQAGAIQGGKAASLRLAGGAVAVLPEDGGTPGVLTVPVVLDGPASLAAQAHMVRSVSGNTLEPFDVIWKALLPGFSSITSMAVDGQQARIALLNGQHPDPAKLWLAKGDLSSHGYPAHTLMLRGRDESGHPRTRYAYLRWEQRMGAFQEVSMFPNPFTVTGGEQDQDWYYEEETHTLHILSSQVTAISGGAGTDARQEPFSGRIELLDSIGALKLALGGVVCRVSSGRAFHLGRDNDVTLVLRSGTNNIFESGEGCAGISLGDGTSLHIDCAAPKSSGETAGTLTATGGTGGAGIGQDGGGDRSGHIMIRGGMVTGTEKPGPAGSVTIVGSASGGAGGSSDLGSARTWARMSLFLQLGDDAVILPQFPLSSRTLQLNKLRVTTREYARAARMTIDADRRWVAQVQTAYSSLSNHLEQRANGPVRDNTAASVLLREVARSAPILSDRAMQVRSLRSLEDVNRLLR